MCLIIASNPNSPRVDKSVLESAASLNKDGIGIAYALNNNLTVVRGFESLEKFIKYYENIPLESSILIHFRSKSSGLISEDNLHPFIINENLCFAFNGTISELNFANSDKSDTHIFNNIILKPLDSLNHSFYKEPAVHKLLDSYIKNSKMVFLDNEGNFIIINETLGSWNDKENKQIWYSNKLWEKKMETDKTAETYENYRKRKKEKCRPFVQAPVANLTFSSAKKKFYRVGDQYYQPLSEEDLMALSRKYSGLGVKKLKKRGVIARLGSISDKTRLDAWLKFKNLHQDSNQKNNTILDGSIEENTNNLQNTVLPSTFDFIATNEYDLAAQLAQEYSS